MAKKPFPFSVCENCCRDGLSAYEIAKQNGFEGTEEEWLESLHADCDGYTKTEVDSKLELLDADVKNNTQGIKSLSDAITITGNLTGNPVKANGVSEFPHSVGLKVRSKNMADLKNPARFSNLSAAYNEPQLILQRTNTAYNAYSNLYVDCGYYADFVGKTVTVSLENLNEYEWLVSLVGLSDSFSVVGSTIAAKMVSQGATTLTATIPEMSGAVKFGVRIMSADNSIATEEEYIFQNIQVEIGSTATDYTPYVDVSGVTVKRYGKNLVKPDGASKTLNGVTFTNNGDGTFSIAGTATTAASFAITNTALNPVKLKKGVTYSHKMTIVSGTVGSINPSVKRGNGETIFNYFPTSNSSVTPTEDVDLYGVGMYVAEGKTVDGTFKYQLEAGAERTEYEPYVDPETYTADSNGVAEVPSLSPNMTITCDADVIMEGEYKKGINILVEQLVNAIISLGGNV